MGKRKRQSVKFARKYLKRTTKLLDDMNDLTKRVFTAHQFFEREYMLRDLLTGLVKKRKKRGH